MVIIKVIPVGVVPPQRWEDTPLLKASHLHFCQDACSNPRCAASTQRFPHEQSAS